MDRSVFRGRGTKLESRAIFWVILLTFLLRYHDVKDSKTTKFDPMLALTGLWDTQVSPPRRTGSQATGRSDQTIMRHDFDFLIFQQMGLRFGMFGIFISQLLCN